MSEQIIQTRNGQLEKLAEAAADFLAAYEHLPEVAIASVNANYRVSSQAEIELQVVGGFDRVLAWARALDTPVRFTDHETYVDVSTWTSIQGHSVRVWTHEGPGLRAAC